MIERGGVVTTAEGHLSVKDGISAELRGAALTSAWMSGLEALPPERSRRSNT